MNMLYKTLMANNSKLKDTVEYINGYFYTAEPKKPNEDYSNLIKDFGKRGFEVTIEKPYVSNSESISLKSDNLSIDFFPYKKTSISFNEKVKDTYAIRYVMNNEKVEVIFVNDIENLKLLFMFQIEDSEKINCIGVNGKYKGLKTLDVSIELLSLIIDNKNNNKKEIYDLINLNYDINIKNNLILNDFIDIINNGYISKNKLSS